MIEGFSTLGEALDGLGDRLSASIDILSERVRQLEGGQGARHESLAASLQEIAASEASQRDKIAADQARSADKQLAMLENIQRQRMRSF